MNAKKNEAPKKGNQRHPPKLSIQKTKPEALKKGNKEKPDKNNLRLKGQPPVRLIDGGRADRTAGAQEPGPGL